MNQRGFTLIELVLAVALITILFGTVYRIMDKQISAYSFMAEREEALENVTYAMDRITHELLHVKTADIIDMEADSIDFVDLNGNPVSLSLQPLGNGQGLFREDEPLAGRIKGMAIRYLDQNGNPTNVKDKVRSFEITLTSAERGTEGEITQKTLIHPREYIYENYR